MEKLVTCFGPLDADDDDVSAKCKHIHQVCGIHLWTNFNSC